MKYAIKVHLDENTWLYVSDGPVDNMRPWTTESLEEAEAYRQLWLVEDNEETIEIVEYQC
jgi:hypothetical protein